jgi:lysophospholipase L1-like esterase
MIFTTLAYIGLGLFILLVIAGLWLLYYARDYAPSVPPAIPGTVRVACVGDSITFGALVKHRKVNCYPAQLEKLLGSGYSVRNFGANGHSMQRSADKPYWTHPYFDASLAFEPQIVLLMLGTNDAAEYNWQGIEPYISEYRKMLTYYETLPSRPTIYILTPPVQFPVENPTKVIHALRTRELDEITAALRKLGAELSLGVIDIHTAMENRPEYFKFDGLHPDAGGARLIAETVYLYLKDRIKPL